MVAYYEKLLDEFPIISIEDGLQEDDWEGWKQMTEILGERVQLVGDDLFVTNIKRLKCGIRLQTANAILIKVNQIGTLSEAIQSMAKITVRIVLKICISVTPPNQLEDIVT